MKCPNDQTEMEKGTLFENGQIWNNKGPLKMPFGIGKAIWVTAYKCPKCGKVELKVDE